GVPGAGSDLVQCAPDNSSVVDRANVEPGSRRAAAWANDLGKGMCYAWKRTQGTRCAPTWRCLRSGWGTTTERRPRHSGTIEWSAIAGIAGPRSHWDLPSITPAPPPPPLHSPKPPP